MMCIQILSLFSNLAELVQRGQVWDLSPNGKTKGNSVWKKMPKLTSEMSKKWGKMWVFCRFAKEWCMLSGLEHAVDQSLNCNALSKVPQIVGSWDPCAEEEETERGNGGEKERVRNFDPGKISPTRAWNKVLNGSIGLKMDQKGLKSVVIPKIPFPSIHHS